MPLESNIQIDDTPSFYHYEYTVLHQERMMLVRRVHLWYQIGIPLALGLFSIAAHLAIEKTSFLTLISGFVMASGLLFGVWWYGIHNDRGIRNLYPKLITLELILDFHFWRTYLKAAGPSEQIFVERCESLLKKCDSETIKNVTVLWEAVTKEFDPKKFSAMRRAHDKLLIIIIVISFALLVSAMLMALRYGLLAWQYELLIKW